VKHSISPRSIGDATEKALLRAVKAAKAAYESGTHESRPLLRDAYLHTLRAFNAYVAAQSPKPDDSNQRNSQSGTVSTSEQQYRTLMAVCGLE
jgi:hypothetical protein